MSLGIMAVHSHQVIVIQSGRSDHIATGAALRNRVKIAALGAHAQITSLHVEPAGPAGTAQRDAGMAEQQLRALDPATVRGFVIDSTVTDLTASFIRAHFPRAWFIADFHNVESHLLEQTDRARYPWWLRTPLAPFHQARWRRARSADAAAAAMAERAWTCSPEEASRLAKIAPGVAVDVVPNAPPQSSAAAERAGARRREKQASPVLLFVGHLGYAPNKIAARFLARRVLPQVRHGLPGAGVVIAGRSPNTRLLAELNAAPGVTCLVSPPDLTPLYEAADITVMPLFEGGGTRIKALEAAKWRLPIVATELAVEGLGMSAGKHFLRAETPAQFADAIGLLAADPVLAASIADAAAALVDRDFSPEAIREAVWQSIGKLEVDRGRRS
jgi:glycosyltransferase involved in cell wall biosynthesis